MFPCSLWAAVPLLLALGGDPPKNVLLIIADDLGVDRIAVYDEHPDPGRTPVVDELARHGVLFRNVWSNPVCSPTRATMLTGRYGFRTGVGLSVSYVHPGHALMPEETTLPEVLSARYRTAAIGKWHLGNPDFGGVMHPLIAGGFDHHVGPLANLDQASGALAYFEWEKSVDGVLSTSQTYATTDAVDEALAKIEEFGDDPWFLWVAFNAPHKPFHKPPDHLHGYDLPPEIDDDPVLHMKAIVEAMDTEIGRLIRDIRPAVLDRTTIIFIGDNGTMKDGTTAPFDPKKAKGKVFEGGVNVPLVIAGAGVRAAGHECQALVNTTDIFATVVELAGLEQTTGVDSVSMVPYLTDPYRPSLRPWVYAEKFKPNGFGPYAEHLRAVRGPRFKLVDLPGDTFPGDGTQFFDLWLDPFEEDNLLPFTPPIPKAQKVAYRRLLYVLENMR